MTVATNFTLSTTIVVASAQQIHNKSRKWSLGSPVNGKKTRQKMEGCVSDY